ncbi:MAG TPA: pseudouridine synthase, partial [Candidatus Limnocylindria bacterium]|nr:pseudouridine synthase [Candidatus Limnocylindria bacterium]
MLARAGIGSRRACEQLIEEGRIEVDGRTVREQGMRVDPSSVVIRVDGVRLAAAPDLVHLAINKPQGVVSTMHDPEGRPCLGDYVEGRKQRLFHVGRLDADTEGLILLTNDGELGHRLMHPSHEVPKTYLADIPAPVPRDLGRRLREGIELEDGPASVDSFRVVSSAAGRALVEVVLHEGRNHIVRRMLAAVDHPVDRLVRTKIGPVFLGDLRPGRVRPLNRAEVGELYAA